MLRAIIIDDEPAGINTLKLLIEKHGAEIRVVASTTEAEEGIQLIENYRPDIVFLDISMPDMSGFELLKKVEYKDFKLIFTTAHREYALQAIKNDAFDYLLKPVDVDDLKLCITKVMKEFEKDKHASNNRSPELIEIASRDGILYLKQKDIVRLEASGSYTNFYLDNGVKHLASKAIKEYEMNLDAGLFFRCHNSHIINLHKVERFVNHEGFFAKMNDGTMVDISRRNKDLFLERIKSL
jgi:two-component system, LytTR family, response regulator